LAGGHYHDGVGSRKVATNPTSGTLAARPAASIAGRLYTATDIGGGISYLDTGAAWIATGPSAGLSLSSVTTFTGNAQAANTDVTIASFGTIPASALAVGSTFAFRVG